MPAARRDPAEPAAPAWCLVGNVVRERPVGEGGAETRRGTRHFAPGAKVYVLHSLDGGDFERIEVVGCHRGAGGRLVRMIVSSRVVTNWRAQVVYSPLVLGLMRDDYYRDRDHWNEAGANRTVALMTDRELRRAGRPQRYGTQHALEGVVPTWQPSPPWLYDLHDARNTDHRRTALGLPPLRESLAEAWDAHRASRAEESRRGSHRPADETPGPYGDDWYDWDAYPDE